MLDYRFHTDKVYGSSRTLSLALRGMSFYCNKTYADTSEKDVPIVKVTSETDLWGLQIDCNISAVDCSIVVDEEGSGHYISTATVHKAYIPNYTGLQLVTNGGYMTNVTVKGELSNLYYGITEVYGGASGDWMTALDLDAHTKCFIGAKLWTQFSPLIVRGQHQTIRAAASNNDNSYFICKNISMQGFVYDLGVSSNGIYAVKNAMYLYSGESDASWVTGNQLQYTKFDDKVLFNYFRPPYSFNNILNSVLNSGTHQLFDGGYVRYKVKLNEGEYIDVLQEDDANTYFNVTNPTNIFGDGSLFITGNNSTAVTKSDQSGVIFKSGYRANTYDFKVELSGTLSNISNYNNLKLYVAFLTGVHSGITISIYDRSKSAYVVENKSINTARIYRENAQEFSLPSNFDVTINFKITTTGGAYSKPLPIIFMPDIYNDFKFYEGAINPNFTNNKAKALYHPLSEGYNKRLFYLDGTNIYDMDGFKMAMKVGTTAQRPSSP